jgi:hypothetical protein
VTRLDVSFPAFTLDDAHKAYSWDLHAVADEFPEPDDERWTVFRGEHEPMKRQGGPNCWGPATTEVIVAMMGPAFTAAVASLLGRQALVADVYGGGMHLSGPGAHLDIHADFNLHPRTRWRRRANALLFLNEGWQAEWGGVLELDHKARVLPEFGKLVIFETSDRSWHGHPTPITDGHWRKSLAVYFFDPLDQVGPAEAHDTQWYAP